MKLSKVFTVSTISIGMYILASSSMAFDLGGMLNKVSEAAKKLDNASNTTAPAPTIVQPQPTASNNIEINKTTISQPDAGVATKSTASNLIPEVITPAEYCELVTKSQSVNQFSDYMKSVLSGVEAKKYVISEVMDEKQIDLDIDIYASNVAYPDNKDLLENWRNKKLTEIAVYCSKNINSNECKSLVAMIGGYKPANQWDNSTNLFKSKNHSFSTEPTDGLLFQDAYFKAVYRQCGEKLITSKLNGTVLLSQLRVDDFNNYYSALEACRKSPSKMEKRVLEDGSIQNVENKKDCSIAENNLETKFSEASTLPKVLMFKNGEKLFQNASSESLNILKPKLQKLIKDGSAVLAANKLTQDKIEKMRKSGDFSGASSCDEVASALNLKSTTIGDVYHGSYIAKINATNSYLRVGGVLDQLTGDSGFMKGSEKNEFAGITISKKTVWIQKNDIGMKTPIYTVGKYSSNKTITLNTGKSLTIPVYEMICIAPSASAF